jgi:hypothetical protein
MAESPRTLPLIDSAALDTPESRGFVNGWLGRALFRPHEARFCTTGLCVVGKRNFLATPTITLWHWWRMALVMSDQPLEVDWRGCVLHPKARDWGQTPAWPPHAPRRLGREHAHSTPTPVSLLTVIS